MRMLWRRTVPDSPVSKRTVYWLPPLQTLRSAEKPHSALSLGAETLLSTRSVTSSLSAAFSIQ